MRGILMRLYSVRELDTKIRKLVIDWFKKEIKDIYNGKNFNHIYKLIDDDELLMDAMDSLGYEFLENGKLFNNYKLIAEVIFYEEI